MLVGAMSLIAHGQERTETEAVDNEKPSAPAHRRIAFEVAENGKRFAFGPTVFTLQLYDFKDVSGDFGKSSFLSAGLELIDVGKGIERAIIGGTGPFKTARGQITQTFLGTNATQGFVLRFETTIR
jgi:hypothetical protein